MRFIQYLLLSLAAAVLCAPQYVNAQDSIEEVIVTARKRDENIQSIPDSIQALSAGQIQDRGISEVRDVVRQVSGFTLVEAQQPGVVFVNVRGVGAARNSEASIAVVIDGVQQNSPNQITQELFDVQSIEVLKGPQGALYGRNAIGGVINIVTERPTNEFTGRVSGSFAEGDDYRVGFMASGPLVEDKLLFRVAGQYRDREGQIDNVTHDEKVDFTETYNGQLKLLATPSEALAVVFRAWMQRQDAGSAPYLPGSVNDAPEFAISDIVGTSIRDLDDTSLKIDYEYGSTTFTSITALSKVESFLDEDLDYLPLDMISATQALDVDAWSQEFRLSSNSDSGVQWIVGAYFLHMDRDLDTEIFLRPDLTTLPDPILLAATRTTDDNDAWALFGQVEIPFGDAWKLTGALRYDEDSRVQVDRVPLPGALTEFSADFRSSQPKISLSYELDDGSLAYVTAGKGFRSGGFNANAVVTREYKKEELWNYEVGYKTTFADNKVVLNGAIFYMDVVDKQIYGLDLSQGPNQFIANPIPESHIFGGELELIARPLSNLVVNLGLTLLNTEIDEYDTTVFANTAANGDFTGNGLGQTPSYTFNVGVQHTWRLNNDSAVKARIDASGLGGDYYWEIDNLDKRDDYWLTDLRLSYERGRVAVTAFARNIFDERTDEEFVPVEWSGAISGDLGAPSAPRQVGLSLNVSFGNANAIPDGH